MKKVSLLIFLTLATFDAFASEKGNSENLESPQPSKKHASLEQYPTVKIRDILTDQIKTFSQIDKQSLKDFFNEELHVSTTSVSRGTRYTANLDEVHVNYIQLLSDSINIDEYDAFIYDPNGVDAGGIKGSLIIPIKCLKEDTQKTIRLLVRLPSKLLLKETSSQTTTPLSLSSPRISPKVSLSLQEKQSTTTLSQNQEVTKPSSLGNETLVIDTITSPPVTIYQRRPSIKQSSSPQTSEDLIEELKKVHKQMKK